ncbi:MAG: hypothetical protein RR581_06195 [Eubacterium sp.]
MRKRIILATLLFVAIPLLFTGCRSFLIPQDLPIPLNNDYNLKQNQQNKIEILSFETISNGIIQDISYDGTTLLLLNIAEAPPITFNIDLLKISTNENKLTSFVNSDKREINALFDEYSTGVFYIEENLDTSNNKMYNQLVWTSLDRSNTKTISLPDENVSKNICTLNDNNIIYTNSNNEIVVADSKGNRTVYNTSRNITITSINSSPKDNKIFFTGENPTNEKQINLYSADLTGSSGEVTTTLIDENVLNFDVNRQKSTLIYTQANGDQRRIMCYNFNTNIQPSVVSEGNFTSAVYAPNAERILYSQFSSTNTRSSQSIWIMDNNGKNKMQLSAPLTLTSKIISHPYKSTIYFSVEKKYDESVSENKVSSQIYQIDYNIN